MPVSSPIALLNTANSGVSSNCVVSRIFTDGLTENVDRTGKLVTERVHQADFEVRVALGLQVVDRCSGTPFKDDAILSHVFQ